MGALGVLEAVQEEEVVGSEDEVRRALTELRAKSREQGRQLSSCKRRIKEQNVYILQLQRGRDNILKMIESQLMLFEGQLRRRSKELEGLLQHKDVTIRRQQELILQLTLALEARSGTIPDTNHNNTKNQVDSQLIESTTQVLESNVVKEEKTKSPLFTSTKGGDPDSLNDSDSAIMLEDNCDSLGAVDPTSRAGVRVIRSVSDAVECANRSGSTVPEGVKSITSDGLKSSGSTCSSSSGGSRVSSSSSESKKGSSSSISTSPSCSSEESDDSPACTLKKGRAELLRTVYSLDEEVVFNARRFLGHDEHDSLLSDTHSLTPSLTSILKVSDPTTYDSDATLSDGESSDDDDESVRTYDGEDEGRRQLLGSFEKLNTLGDHTPYQPVKPRKEEETIQVTYNRVMSNHRSVTKPKDVKYKRINKAKSRSLEELRGKLKHCTDKNGKLALSFDKEQSYA
ncbi:uncharacterized protein LOC143019661 [Oratosquilla oratoria]|uniref:uncharacterized protein LOC143019661 n=1 Tax=Oratosquilla oratoria TaxID=337810 RepID=UPI003F757E55